MNFQFFELLLWSRYQLIQNVCREFTSKSKNEAKTLHEYVYVEINKYTQQPAMYVLLTYTIRHVVSNPEPSTIFITGGK